MIRRGYKPGLSALASAVLFGCGGGGNSGPGTGTLSVGVTDAPVDGVTDVWVEFDAITLKHANGEQQVFTFDPPRKVNLKELTDGKIELLLDEEVTAGEYIWMKLDVNAELDGYMDSYVMEDGGGMVELRIPPDRLKLGNHFTVVQGGRSAFVIEWNLRMGLTDPVGQDGYKLQPSLRIIDMAAYGTIAGTVDTGLITAPPCTSDPNTGDGNVVYVYEELDISPDDIDGIAPDPLTTADVRLNQESGNHEYLVPFLPAGDYTVAFTCEGADDVISDEDQPGLAVDDTLTFTDGVNAEVVDGQTTVVDFNGV